jgi:outer membrane protein
MKRSSLALAVAAVSMVSLSAMADQGDWLVRGRVIQVKPSVSSTLNLGVSTDTIPELDFSYFASPNVALELILGTSRHEVSLGGASLGKVSVLPPTLTAQYHFNPKGQMNPYIGAGVNYTRFYNVGLALGGAPLDVSKNSWGGALQAGMDIAVGKNTFINLDVKKIYIKTDVSLAGSKLDTLKIDPVVFGAGFGMRF